MRIRKLLTAATTTVALSTVALTASGAAPAQHEAAAVSTPVVTAVRPAEQVANRSEWRDALDAKIATAERVRRHALERQRAHRRAVARARRRLALIYSSAQAWAHQPHSIAVANCESGTGPHGAWQRRYVGNPHLADANGHYGKWQFAPATAYSVGAPGAAIAQLSETAQDYYAWKLWKRDGWGPWQCAGLV